MCSRLRLCRSMRKDFLRRRFCPCFPFRSGLPFSGCADPQPISVIQSCLPPAPFFFIALWTCLNSFLNFLMLGAYGCRAAALKCFLTLRTLSIFLRNRWGAFFFVSGFPESPARIVFACLSALWIALSEVLTSFAYVRGGFFVWK